MKMRKRLEILKSPAKIEATGDFIVHVNANVNVKILKSVHGYYVK